MIVVSARATGLIKGIVEGLHEDETACVCVCVWAGGGM
jgi:hypothetical protein